MRRSVLSLLVAGCGTLTYYPAEKDDVVPIGTSPSTDPTTGSTVVDSGGGSTDWTLPSTTSSTTTSTSTTTTTTTTTTPPAPPFVPVLDAVTPAFGSNLGGASLVATGSFDPSTVLRIDGVDAPVVSYAPTELVVTVPGSTKTGWVDVEARAGAESDVLPSGFQYWQDATGQAGLFAYMSYIDVVGGYWANPSDYAFADAGFIEPSPWEVWSDFAPALDECAYEYPGAALTFIDPGAASIEWDGAPDPIFLVEDATTPGLFYDDNLIANEAVPGTVYDMPAIAGTPDWPSFDVPGVLQLPPKFNVLTPNLDKANLPLANTSESFTITWDGVPGDYVLLWMLRDLATDDVVTCALVDDGSFTIPLGTWPTWPLNKDLHVQVGRVYQSDTTLPHNNADNRAAGMYWVYGALNTN